MIDYRDTSKTLEELEEQADRERFGRVAGLSRNVAAIELTRGVRELRKKALAESPAMQSLVAGVERLQRSESAE